MVNPLNETPVARNLESLLTELCDRYGFTPVPKLEWSKRMVRTLGLAFPSKNIIRLSAWLEPKQAESTLRHELAHIATGKAGARHPHGAHWKRWAVELGALPWRTSAQGPTNAPKRKSKQYMWGLECPKCGLRLARKRVRKGLYHRDCGPKAGRLTHAMRGTSELVYAWIMRAIDETKSLLPS